MELASLDAVAVEPQLAAALVAAVVLCRQQAGTLQRLAARSAETPWQASDAAASRLAL